MRRQRFTTFRAVSAISIVAVMIAKLFMGALVLAAATTLAADAAYDKATAYYEQKNFDACLTSLRPAIQDAENNIQLRILAAQCHIGKKSYGDAIYHLKQVVENAPEKNGIRADIVALYFALGKYREGRNFGYKYIAALKDDDRTVPPELSLGTARACLAYGRPAEALELARSAKQSDNNDVKCRAIIVEARALIAEQNLSEADIALSFAEAMRESELHQMLRANIAEMNWVQQKFPEVKRADVVGLYEKLTRSTNAEIRAAAQKNIERVKAAKAS